MMTAIPLALKIAFIFTTLLTLVIFYWGFYLSPSQSTRKHSTKILIGLTAWLGIQGLLSSNNIYLVDTDSLPPKIFLLGVLPLLIIMLCIFLTHSGRELIDGLDIKTITYIHLVRIPVEFILYGLFVNLAIPGILTYEGWNFDLIMGLTAPLIIYFGFTKKVLSINVLLAWNVIGIILLILVFVLAVLSSPSPLQQLAFDQPNVGLLQFPFSWLPTFIVPVVILCHLISIRRLLGQP